MKEHRKYDRKSIKKQLIDFEQKVIDVFEQGKIKAPVHLSRGNEDALLEIFPYVHPDDWVFSTWRSHYHALLHGVSEDWLYQEILDGNSITINNAEHRFFTSAIVGGIIPIAVGTAEALKRKGSDQKVWCFIGDMASMSGIFHESYQWAMLHDLPIVFVIENNNFSTNTPTSYAWWRKEYWGNPNFGDLGEYDIMPDNVPFLQWERKLVRYVYDRVLPHQGSGAWVNFVLAFFTFLINTI